MSCDHKALTLPATARYNGREIDVSGMTNAHMEAAGAKNNLRNPCRGSFLSPQLSLLAACYRPLVRLTTMWVVPVWIL